VPPIDPPAVQQRTRARIAIFYVMALAISWVLWAPWVAAVHTAGARGWRYLHLVGSLGPALSALAMLAVTGGRARLRQFAAHVFTARGAAVALGWGLLFPTVLFVASAFAMARATGRPIAWARLSLSSDFPELTAVGYALASLVCYGAGEELGWRGFLYPAFRRARGPLVAALAVVPFWALWHAPLFVTTESYRQMGLGGALGWLLSLVSGGVLTGRLYDRAGGSVLPAIVLHTVLDLYFLADVGVPVQSALGALVTVWGAAEAIAAFREGRVVAPTG
jgi:membrane protease YdiL (CAAX protease family)